MRILKFIMFLMVMRGMGRGAAAADRVIRLPAGAIQPQTAIDSHGRLHLIYFKGEADHGDLFYEQSADDGDHFTQPLRVNSQTGSAIATGTIRGAQLAIGKGDRPHVAWMGSSSALPKIGAGQAPMLYARLNDAGDGFEPQRNLITSHPGLDGGGSIAADPDGNVYVGWHAPDGSEREADRRVWICRSSDNGQTFSPEQMAFPEKTGACGCCGLRMAAASHGRVYILYRSASEMVHRDMYLLASSDHGRRFNVINVDPWEVGYCVMSTAALLPTDKGVVAAWETHEQIYVQTVVDGEKPSAPVLVSGKGRVAKHPALAINPHGEWIVSWTEGTGWNKGGSLAWRLMGSDGKPKTDKTGRAQGLPVWDLSADWAARDGAFRIFF